MIFNFQTLGFEMFQIVYLRVCVCVCGCMYYIDWHLVQMGGTHVTITKAGSGRQDRDGLLLSSLKVTLTITGFVCSP